MYTVEEIAKKILWIDKRKNLFKNNDESCFRLMNYLFMLSIRWYAKTKTYLINETFLCHENGAYISDIDNNYEKLEKNREDVYTDNKVTNFIEKFYYYLDDSTNEEVADIAKEDPAYAGVYKTKSDEYKEVNTKEFEPYYAVLYEHTIRSMEEGISNDT